MDTCCQHIEPPKHAAQRRVLGIVLALNAAMFAVEVAGGLIAGSTAVSGDSGAMLGDAVAYGASLYAIGRGRAWEGRATFIKGGLMLLVGVGVAAQATYGVITGAAPHAAAMGGLGIASLFVNGACVALLVRHRTDGLNMRSAWACSRNDLLSGVLILVAAAGVAATGAWWPDLLAAGVITAVEVTTAIKAMSSGCALLREPSRQLASNEP